MIMFFPTFYEDELIYSVCARYYVKSGYQSYIYAAEDLFKRKTDRPDLEFINSFNDEILDVIKQNYDVKEVIENHTMFPYYGRFVNGERKQKAFQCLCNMEGGYYNLLPMRIRKDGNKRYMRYCPLCVKEDREKYGETYWHRLHQMMGLYICPLHSCYLENSKIPIASKESPRLYCAELEIPDEVESKLSDNELELRLSKYMSEVFQENIDIDSDTRIGDFFHSRLALGKYRSIRGEQRNMVVLCEDFNQFYQDLEHMNYMELWQMQKIFVNQRVHFDEVCMIAMFLDISVKELVKPEIQKIADADIFDNKVMELHNHGLKYPQIAKILNASYDTVKAIGESRYKKVKCKKHNKGGCKKKDWNTIDKKTLPEVTAAIKKLYGDGNIRPKKISVFAVCKELDVNSKYFNNLPLCKAEILRYYESQESYWAREVIWAVNQIIKEGQPVNWKHIRDKTNMRNVDFQACKPYLKNFADSEMVEIIQNLL